MPRQTPPVTKDASYRTTAAGFENATRNLKRSAATPNTLTPVSQGKQRWNLQTKVTIWAIALGILPIFTIAGAIFLSNQSINRQIETAKTAGNNGIEEVEAAVEQQLPMLWMGAGAIALLTGGVAAFLANRVSRPIVQNASVSNEMVNRLQHENVDLRYRAEGDELSALSANLNVIETQLPQLLLRQEAESQRSQTFQDVTRRIRTSFFEEDVLRTTVEEVRKALRTDRVIIFRFDENWDGTIVEESVTPGWPKALWSTISDPCFADRYVKLYKAERVRATDDIYNAGLTDCHIGILERFAVKANLVTPIMVSNELFGLLIAHQCSGPRQWEQPEIDLVAQIAMQVGFALEYTNLLEQFNTKANRARVLVEVTRRIRASLSEDDVLQTTVQEVRKALRADRAIVYSFDDQWYGTVVAEAVLPVFPEALWAEIRDPCFAQGFVPKYQAGRVQATNNIYEAGLTDCHIEQLARFDVKANLVTPIIREDKLFGLLIVHQCSGPRTWQQTEVDLVAQIASQVGFALSHARFLKQVGDQGTQNQLITQITRQIRETIFEEEILKTTVTDTRKAIEADRVIVYSFDEDWYGTVVAEAVLPGFPKALWAEIHDPCFAEGYVEKYQDGRVQATNDVQNAGLTPCHLKQLEPFAVRANLVAPIIKDGELFGLLIAHQCSGPRTWKQTDIELVTQVAAQVGSAIKHARLLSSVEKSYQSAEGKVQTERQQRDKLTEKLSTVLTDSETAIQSFSNEAIGQLESINTLQNHIRVLDDAARTISTTAQSAEIQGKQVGRIVQIARKSIEQAVVDIISIREALNSTVPRIKGLEDVSQEVSKSLASISNSTSRLKLQATMSQVKLDDADAGVGSGSLNTGDHEWISTLKKVNALVQKLDADITTLKPLISTMKAETQDMATTIGVKTQQVEPLTQMTDTIQQELNQLMTASDQMNAMVDDILQTATDQSEVSTAANQALRKVTSITQKISESSEIVSESFSNLSMLSQDIQTSGNSDAKSD